LFPPVLATVRVPALTEFLFVRNVFSTAISEPERRL